MRRTMRRFAGDESAATAMEYGLLVAGIGIALIAALAGLSGGISSTLATITGFLASH